MREKSTTEKTEDSVTVKKHLAEQVKQFSSRAIKLEGEVLKGEKTVAELIIKLKVAKKRAKDVTHERVGPQGHLQESQRGHEKGDESITCVQATNDCFSAGLKREQEYKKCLANEEGLKMLNNFELRWLSELLKYSTPVMRLPK